MHEEVTVASLTDAIKGLDVHTVIEGTRVLSDHELAECIFVQLIANRLQAERVSAR